MLNRNSRERKSPLRTVLHKRPRANGARASLEWQVLFLFILFFLPALSTAAQTNVLTYHNDSARTGQNLNETLLTLSNVNSTNFGKLGSLSVDGQVDAQPLYVANLTVAGSLHNVVFIVTEHDSVYAFDADTFAQLWKVTVLGSGETASDNRGCDQVSPEIGITSTPVIDLSAGPNGTIFAVAMSKDNFGNYHQRLHALDVTTGAEISGSPKEIQATYPTAGGGTTTFAPGQYKERASLLLLNGVIYTSWASHCDITPYSGWVMGYSETTLQQVNIFNFTPNGSEGSVWMSGAGPAADSLGNIYFPAANGTFDTTLNANGFPVNGDYGNAFMKLSTSGNSLSAADYFTMHNTVAESNVDQDLGSGGALLLPDLTDSLGNIRHLAVGAGKDSIIYVADRDSMGKFNSTSDNIYQEISANGLAGGSGVYAMPAYFNGTLYYGAVNDSLRAFTIANARVVAPPSSNTASTFAYPGTTPSISANGTSNGIVWAVENSGGTGILHAYDATNLANELYSSNQAGTRDQFSDNKFITPMIANGKVFVGTPTSVIVFGLLNGGTPPALLSIAVTPANSSIPNGTTQQFSATGSYSDGSTQNLTNSVTWGSSNTSVAAINSTGLATAAGTGNTTISAFSGSVGGSTTLTVTSPGTSAGAAYVQSASGNDNYNTSSASAKFSSNVTVNDAIAVFCVWTGLSQTLYSVTDTQGDAFTIVDNPTNGTYGRAAMAYAIARSSGGDSVSCNFSTASMGKSIIVHEISGVNTSTPLDGHNTNIQNSPGIGTDAITSTSTPTTMNGDYIVGFTFNDSVNQADWSAGTGYTKRQDLQTVSYTTASEDRNQSLSGSVAAVFTATAAAFGDFITGIMAFRSQPGTAAALVSIAVTPTNPSIAKGTMQPITATGTYSDGSTQNLTSTVIWTSSSTSVATVTGSGVASGVGVGASTIQAASASVTGSTALTVTAPVLNAIAVSPANSSIPNGTTEQFTATGSYSDGSTQNLTNSVTWGSSNTSVATINSTGLATAAGTGNTTISAFSGSVSASTTLTVTAPAGQGTAYVQSASGNDHYNTSSASAKFPSNVTANDAIAVFCVWESLSQTLNSVTDTQGNIFTILNNPTTGRYGSAAMAYAIARSTGGDTVSCNLSTASMGKSIIIHEISGVNVSTPLDGQKLNVQNSPGGGVNAVTSGSITTTVNRDYVLGFTFNDSSNQADWNAGAGYTKRQDLQVQSYATASQDKVQTLSGSVAATFTATAATFGDFITGIIAFRPM